MKYQVEFAGFAYVEADSKEEAIQKAEKENVVNSEIKWIVAKEIDKFKQRTPWTKEEYLNFKREYNPWLNLYLYSKDQWSEPKYQCEKCGGNMRKNETIILPSNPPKFEYQCDKCKNIDYLNF